MTPSQVIATVAGSGLRGRGGAGFPTGAKWRTAAQTESSTRYVVANGYGADPAVQTDRTLMELAPYAVIEGVALAAYAIGARDAFIAVRAEAAETIRRLRGRDRGGRGGGLPRAGRARVRLGPDARGRPVQGAYMLGEETVLLKALEGKRGQPEQRPPHPAERGLFGRPTVVDNVQTLASVPWIVRHGADAFAAIGSKASPGTILVQVRAPAGAGIAEVPLGTSLRTVIGLVGGRTRPGRTPHRAPRSRPSSSAGRQAGSCRPTCSTPRTTSTPLRAVDAHVGSGSIVVADERACIVDLARLLTRFCADQACGKTIPCRIGTRRLSEIADRIAVGTPRPTDVGAGRGPRRRRRRLGTVRPRAPGDPPADQRDAILPTRAGRASPPQHLSRRRLSPDRDGSAGAHRGA